MADISKIKTLDGTTYDIKDTTARNLIPTNISDLTNDSGFITGMEILSYGSSTWNDFITAYNAKKVVYCRASSNSDPASGSQTRLAFMAYVNNATNPTSVEFQYYRSVSSHSDAQQGDQVFIYKLTSAGTWTVTIREAYTKITAGSNMSSSYANGTLTLNATGSDTTDALPLAGGTMSGNINMDSNKVTNLSAPTANGDATSKEYVDNLITIGSTQPATTQTKIWLDPADTTNSTTEIQVPTISEMNEALEGKEQAGLGISNASVGDFICVSAIDANGKPTSWTRVAQSSIINSSNIVSVSDTQPTDIENKLWVDTDAGVGSSYQIPTVAEMEVAISSHAPVFRTNTVPSEAIVAGDTRTVEYSIPQIEGYTVHVVSVHIPDTSNVNYSKVFFVWHQTGNTLYMHIFNTATAQVAPAPRVECIYLPT